MAALVINVFPGRVNDDAVLMVKVPETPATNDAVADALELNVDSKEEPFASLMNDPAPPQVVRACGDALYASLDKVPRFNKTTLDPLAHTPIYFMLETPLSENLPWEALWHRARNSFVALEPNWPIVRLAPVSHQTARDSTIEPELSILIVIAAVQGNGPAKVNGNAEWTEIWQALSTSPAPGKLRVHVLSCQDDILQAIEQLEGTQVRVTGEPMASVEAFNQAVATLQPNIVHFFCHGSSDGAEAMLELATLGDYDVGDLAHGSIMLGISELSALTRSKSLWLMTLNCCEGARANAGASSLAAKLSQQGVPAVVAMRESVDFRKASRFAGAYHSNLLAKLHQLLPDEAAADAGALLEIPERTWIDAMHPSRALLAQAARDRDPAWTLPVVYVQRGALRVKAQRSSASALMLLPDAQRTKITELQMTVATLRNLSAGKADGVGVQFPIAEYQQQADEAEKSALEDYLKTDGWPKLARSIAQQRLDDLLARLKE